jgi:hypothetical protein
MPIVSELRDVIGALQREVEFETAGGDRSVLCGRRRLRQPCADSARGARRARPAQGEWNGNNNDQAFLNGLRIGIAFLYVEAG